MINLDAIDDLLTTMVEMLDPNQTTEAPGERSAAPANTTVGGGVPRGAGISGAQMTQHQNQFSGQRNVPASLGLDDRGTIAGSDTVRSSDAGISGSQMTKHQNDFAHYHRMAPSVALGLGRAGRSSGGSLDSAR